jgi:integrase
LHAIAGTKGLGLEDADRAGRTPLIPTEVRTSLFQYAENVVSKAELLLDARDRGEISAWDQRMLAIRDAGLYLLSISSGMRNQEVAGVENGSWRQEVRAGVTYTWVRSVERKTGKGPVEYLIPPQMVAVLEVLQRFAQPFQARLAEEIANLERQDDREGTIERLQRLRRARRSLTKVFLSENTASGSDGTGHGATRVDVLTRSGCRRALKRMTEAVGSDWDISPHQCRRTYARMFAESRMGRASLIFLKWQFKHSSMSMTQLYAANPLQDATLYDEILEELSDFKAELVGSWLDDTPLSGGAGRAITQLRAIPIKNREALVRHSADSVFIRATGHSWCLAQQQGCGGAGLYEATRCENCKDGVIDHGFASVWQGIHEQQLELMSLQDAGPAVLQRAQREVQRSQRVLHDLGVEIPTGAS